MRVMGGNCVACPGARRLLGCRTLEGGTLSEVDQLRLLLPSVLAPGRLRAPAAGVLAGQSGSNKRAPGALHPRHILAGHVGAHADDGSGRPAQNRESAVRTRSLYVPPGDCQRMGPGVRPSSEEDNPISNLLRRYRHSNRRRTTSARGGRGTATNPDDRSGRRDGPDR